MISMKYFRFIMAFIMALFMSFVMSGVLLYVNLGLTERFLAFWFEGWFKSFVVGYPCVILFMPFAAKLAKKICKE